MNNVSQLKAIAFQLAPKAIKDKVIAHFDRKKEEHWKECYKVKVSQEQVDALFSELALNSDVMVHSSLPDIGNIKLRYVVDNLKRSVIDSGHTVLCPAIPVKGSTLDYLKSIKEFDVRTASNAMGAISCYYGRQEGSKRSLSPTHSVIAFGNKAEEYTNEHHLSETPFSEKSPYHKLILQGGKILLFGSSMKNFTFIRVVDDMIGEECYPVKVYDPHRFEISLIDESGEKRKGTFRTHSHRSGRMLDTHILMARVRRLPSTKVFPLGCSEVVLTDARDVALCLLESLKDGETVMGHKRVSEECKKKADYWIDYIKTL